MKRKLLYVFDNVNYVSGVQKVTAYQVSQLLDLYDITIFSMEKPSNQSKKLFSNIKFTDTSKYRELECLSVNFNKVIKSREFTLKDKLIRVIYAISARLHCQECLITRLVNKNLYDTFNQFDVVCVISEASKLRKLISSLSTPKKVQWIHTDYALWSTYSDWTRMITREDGDIYRHFDRIVCLSDKSRKRFVERYPYFEDKTVTIRNMIPVDYILKRAKEECTIKVDKNFINIITIGRLDREKAFDRIFKICSILVDKGYRFHWYIVGDGIIRKELEKMIRRLKLSNYFFLMGFIENPYCLLKQCDLFALLSIYEGLPVTIDEAKVLHVPVIATNVGGICEQIVNGKNGYLVSNDEVSISTRIEAILKHPECLSKMKKKLSGYAFENEKIIEKIKQVF